MDVTIKCCRARELEKPLVDWTFDLLQRNMKKMYKGKNIPISCMQSFNHLFNSRYEESEWGWDEKDKLREMTDDAAWYLVATSDDNKLVAFSHFRFDVIFQLFIIYNILN